MKNWPNFLKSVEVILILSSFCVRMDDNAFFRRKRSNSDSSPVGLAASNSSALVMNISGQLSVDAFEDLQDSFQHHLIFFTGSLANRATERDEHPQEETYLKEEIDKLVKAMFEEARQELRNEYSIEFRESLESKVNDLENKLNDGVRIKFLELDADFRERHEMLQLQIAGFSEDIKTIDSKTLHLLNEFDFTFNDKLNSLEARVCSLPHLIKSALLALQIYFEGILLR